LGDPLRECQCSPGQINLYRKKLSGPILDRIDLTVCLARPNFQQESPGQQELPGQTGTGESLEAVKMQIQIARERQQRRFKNTRFHHNSELNSIQLKKYLNLDRRAEEYLRIISERTGLSARALTQLQRTALTIADLKNQDQISNLELAEAFQFKNSRLFSNY
jgi:magnesium chelatase family protein